MGIRYANRKSWKESRVKEAVSTRGDGQPTEEQRRTAAEREIREIQNARKGPGRTSVREILRARRADGRGTHPFYWAAFTATGE